MFTSGFNANHLNFNERTTSSKTDEQSVDKALVITSPVSFRIVWRDS